MDRKIILVDENTGEKIGDYKPKGKKKHYHYFLTFYGGLGKTGISITSNMQILLGQMDNNNRVSLDKSRLRTISSGYNITVNALKISISKMVSLGLLQRTDTAVYFVNPYYFSKTNIYRVETLRQEYSELLFDTRRRTTKAKRKLDIDKQIKDISRAKTDPVSRAKHILDNSTPFE